MHRYEELEKAYFKKKLLKYFVVLVIAVLIAAGFLTVKNTKNLKNRTGENINKKKENKINIHKNEISKKELNKTKKTAVKNEKRSQKKEKLEIINFEIPEIDLNTTKKQKPHIQKKITGKPEKVNKKIKKEPLIIEEEISVKDLVKNFNKSPSFDSAIQISEYYLNKNRLDLAKLWAIKANSINPDRYESWKIFAIILLKRNKKAKAKEVLKTYLNDYGENEEIEKLLRSIDE